MISTLTCTNVHAQTITINIRNTPAAKIIDSIVFMLKDADYYIHYENSKIDSILRERINFKVTNLPLSEALDSLLLPFPVRHYINDKHISLRLDYTPKKRNTANKITISGKVMNHRQEPLRGATVYINDRKRGISTDEKGYFEIEVTSLPVPISVSYVGHESAKLQIKDSSVTIIRLTEVIEELDLMINTGYIRQAKDRFTGKLSSVTASEISNNANPDIMQNISIQIPAMIQHFNNDFTNNIPQYQIRGRTTIHANPNPLIILDQIPYQSSTLNIHPDDIARVDVLKDAAASAIWGARSGNGVIVFTTKEGKLNNKASISASLTSGVSAKNNLFANEHLSSSEIIDMELRLFKQNFYDPFYNRNNFPVLSPVVELKYAEQKGLIDAEAVKEKIDQFRTQDIRNDVNNHLQRNASYTQANAQIMGGGNQNTYFFSIGGLKQLHELPNKASNRLTVNTKNRFQPFNGVEFGNHILYTEWKHDLPHDPFGTPERFIQYAPWADENGSPLAVARDYRQSLKDSMTQSLGYRDWNYYPLTEHQNNYSNRYQNELLFQLNAKFKVKKKLHFDFIYNFNFSRLQDVSRLKEPAYEYRHLYNQFSWVEDNEIKSIIPKGEIREEGITDEKVQTYRYTATYHFMIPKWYLRSMVILGGEARKRSIGYTNELKFGFNPENKSSVYIDMGPLYPILNKTSSNIIRQSIQNFNTNENYYSEFLLLTNHWKEKIIVETNIRRDASNLFGANTNNKFIPLWSVGSKFNMEELTQSRHFKHTSININFGKTGNIDHNTTSLLQVLKRNAAQGVGQILYVSKPSDPNLKWETSNNLNVSINKFFEELKLNASIDYYRNNSEDLIINKMTDPVLGINNAWTNDGRLFSDGVEIFLSKEIDFSRKIKWYHQLSFNYNRTKIKSYQSGPLAKVDLLRNPINNIEGESLFNIYANTWNGINPSTGNIVLENSYESIDAYLKETGLNNTRLMGNLIPKSLIRWISHVKIGEQLTIGINTSYRSRFVIPPELGVNNLLSSYFGFHNRNFGNITNTVDDAVLINSLRPDNYFYLNYSDISYQQTAIFSIENFYINYHFKKLNNLGVTLSSNNLVNISGTSTQGKVDNFFRRSFHVNLKFRL